MVAAKKDGHYEVFQQRKARLAQLLHAQGEVLTDLQLPTWAEGVRELEARLNRDTFKVLVLGEFKRGKSTFINAMLQEKVLPAYARPCTAIINEVKWGEEPRAVLHYRPRDDQPTRPAEEIPYEDIVRYCVINDDESTERESPYEKLELFWPLELCRRGVELIDSPGLNESEVRQQVTVGYLSQVDAILFVFTCEALASQSELEVIDNSLRAMGHEDLFFICNRFDAIDEDERDDLKQYALQRLQPRTSRGAAGVFFVSSLMALRGRSRDKPDPHAVQESGLPDLEHQLQLFLTRERAKAKLLQPARELKRTLQEARRAVTQQEGMLRTSMEELERRVQAAREPLALLQRDREQIVSRIDRFLHDMQFIVDQHAREFYSKLAGQVPEWVNGYEIKERITFLTLEGFRPQLERASKEVAEHIIRKTEGEFGAWQKGTLQPLVAARLEDLLHDVGARVSRFIHDADEIMMNLSGLGIQAQGEVVEEDPEPWERILAAAGGFFVGGVASAAIGARFGFGEMAKSIVPQIAIVFGAMLVFGIANPVALVALMFAGGTAQSLFKMKAAKNKVKKAVCDQYVAHLQQASPDQGQKVAAEVVKKLGEIRAAVDQGLEREITSIEAQVASVVEEQRRGKDDVDRRLSQLQATTTSIEGIETELDDLLVELAY